MSIEPYAGRYEIHSMKIPNLFEEIETGKIKPAEKLQQVDLPYKVTLSEQGLKSAKELRAYADQYPERFQTNIEERVEEFNKQLHTNLMDMSNVFREEMNNVMEDLRSDYDLDGKAGSFQESLTLMAKAYQTVAQRIEDEFSNPDRETTYILDAEGNRVVETKEDRRAELDRAYQTYAKGIAAGKSAILQVNQQFKGLQMEIDPDELKEKTYQAYMDAVSEKNLERLKEKVSSFQDYHLEVSIGSEWMKRLEQLGIR